MTEIFLSNLMAWGFTKCPPDWIVNESYACFHRLYYVMSGEAYYTSETESIRLNSNTLYLFPVYRQYNIEHNPNNPLVCVWLHFSLNPIVLSGIINSAPCAVTKKLLEALEILITTNSDEYAIKATSNALIAAMGNALQTYTIVPDKRIEEAIQFINNNYSRKELDNIELAKFLNINTRYFIRLFKKHLGQTPHVYISNYRAFQAIRLLSDGATVSETAQMVGFSDAKVFSRFFKQHYGLCPSKIIKGYFLQP